MGVHTLRSRPPDPDDDLALISAAHAERNESRRSWWGGAAALLIALGLSLLFSRKEFAAPRSSWTGAVGDAEQMMWFLVAIPHALVHFHNPLVLHYALYPSEVNVMWNTSIALPAVLLAPVTAVFGPVASYNLLVLLSPVATAGTTYLALRRYVESQIAAATGALMFAFCPFFMLHSLGHLQVSTLALLPLLFLLGDELLVRQTWRPRTLGAALAVVAVGQLLTGEEILTLAGLLGVAAIVVLAVLHRHQVVSRSRYVIQSAVVAVPVFVVLAAFPLAVQFFGPQRHSGALHNPADFPTDLANLVQPVNQLVSPGILSSIHFLGGSVAEWTGYLGIPLLVILVAVLVRDLRRRPVVPVVGVLFVIFVICSLGTRLHVNGHASVVLPWDLVARLPLLNQVIPGRLTVLVALLVAVLFAVFVDDIHSDLQLAWRAGRTIAPARSALACAGLAALTIVSWIPTSRPLATVPEPGFFRGAVKSVIPKGAVVVVVPYISTAYDQYPLLWQAQSFMRFTMLDGRFVVTGLVQGPTNVISSTFGQLENGPVAVTGSLRSEMLQLLRQNRVSDIIVGPGPGERNSLTFLGTLLGHPADVVEDGVSVWRIPDS